MTMREFCANRMHETMKEYAEAYNKYMSLPDNHKDLRSIRKKVDELKNTLVYDVMCSCGYMYNGFWQIKD